MIPGFFKIQTCVAACAMALALAICGTVAGAPVDPALLRTVSANWLAEKTAEAVDTADLLPVSGTGLTSIAVFNRSGGGWVLVATDDQALPVVGWSPRSAWGGPAIPDNCRLWLQAVDGSIVNATPVRSENPVIAALWDTYSQAIAVFQADIGGATRGTGDTPLPPTVGPLLATTWGQDRYYNTQCPADAAGPDGHALTGCVSTVMAQIMRYFQHPATGYGSHSYTHPIYGTLATDYAATTYDWTAMPADSLSAYNSSVAQLIYHCGVSVDMNYGPAGSSASVTSAIRALKNYFRYHPGIRLLQKPDFTDTEWDNLLKTEIDAGRPVIYDGPGHAFVCDGYDASAPPLYHFNWGWDALYDGYYALSSLTPGSHDYTSEQNATVGIMPEGDIYVSPDYLESFEAAGIPANWFVDGEYLTVTTDDASEGAQSLRMGASADIGYERTGAYVKLAVPATGGALVFDYYRGGAGSSSLDLHTCQIREQYGTGVLATIYTRSGPGTGWEQAVVDLNPYAGQSVTLYFDLVDMTVGGYSWLLVDNLHFIDTPIADFATPRTTWFANRPLTFENLSAGAATYAWTFEGGTPPTSTDPNPTVTYATPGTYDVSLTATNANGDDTQTIPDCITILPEPTLPYNTGFETDNCGFSAYPIEGDDSYEWQWGACSSSFFTGGYASITGGKCWATMLATHHGTNRKYALETPWFSFAAAGDYTLSFKYRAAIGTNGGFNLETSTDGGSSWTTLGAPGDPLATNWYNEPAVPGLDGQPGWKRLSSAVYSPTYNLSALASQSDVRFRFVFGAESSYSDGVQIDDFAISFTPAPNPTYTLTVNSGTGSGTYTEGTVVPVSAAAPAPGFEFDSWTGDTAPLANPASSATTYTMPNANSAITATYRLKTYAVAFGLGEHGTRTGGGELAQTIEHGSPAIAPEFAVEGGWTFTGWDVAFDSITAPLTVTAQYERISYTLAYTAGDHGSVEGVSPQTVFHGDAGAAVEAVPAEGYHFIRWSDGNTDRTRTDTDVTADVTVTAEFAINTYTVTFQPGEHGSLDGGTPDVTHTADYGSPCPAPPTVTPDAEYVFSNWLPELPATITADLTTTAQYELKTYSLTVTNGTGSGAYPAGTVVPVEGAAPAPGFEFDAWTGDTAQLADPASSATAFTMPAANSAITATYRLKTYSATFSLDDHGTRTGGGELSQTVEHGGAAEAPIVEADPGWRFTGWDADFATVTEDLTIGAIYAQYHALTIVSGTGPAEAYAGQQVAVSADAPLAGRTFSRWTGDLAGLENADSAETTLTMPDTDVSLQAVYAFEMALASGWNAVALPFVPLDGSIGNALHAATRRETIPFTAWIWDGTHFQPTSTLTPLQGAWIRVAESATLVFESDEQDTPVLTLNPGWQFVGVPESTDLSLLRGGVVRSWYCPNGKAFMPSDTMQPGQAHWVWGE